MMFGFPFLGFFIYMIWAIGIVLSVAIILNTIRKILLAGQVFVISAMDVFMSLLDVTLVLAWFYIVIQAISFILLELTFQEMFTLIFKELLPIYVSLIAVKFAIANISNRVVEVEAGA